jgi:hypothetical protein
MNFIQKYRIHLLALSIIAIGTLLRLYGLNRDDLWIDEIISYWVADPLITIKESYLRNNALEQIPFTFNLVLKYFFKIFGNNPELGRYLSVMFGILSLFSVSYLAKIIKKNNSYLLLLFLMSFNIYLIKYSQELRVYSAIFFITSVVLIFFFKLIKNSNKKINILHQAFLSLSLIALILLHPFTLIIFFSIITFSIISLIKFKKKLFNINYCILYVSLFSIIYLIVYFKNTNSYPSWIPALELKFFTNFFFSKFFGSRIMGVVHLAILIYLIIKFKKIFFTDFDSRAIFLIILILSYALPLLYSYFLRPILFDRYIIFVLIPILFIISNLIFEIKNKLLKKTLITVLVLSTLINLCTEATFKQFIEERRIYKPDLSGALNVIHNSNYKNFTFNLEKNKKLESYLHSALENYSSKVSKKLDYKLNYYKNLNVSNSKLLWIICLKDLNGLDCSPPKFKRELKIIKDINLNNINLKLLEFH